MRKYLLILFLSLCAASNAQFAPTSAKTRFVNGTALGTRDSSAYAANDSLVVVINRQGRMMYRSTDGYWKVLGTSSDSTAILSQVVRTFGNQTVGGNKTFTDTLRANSPQNFFGTNNTDGYIFLRGFNNSTARFLAQTGVSHVYNGLLISSNPENSNTLPRWDLDLGGNDAATFGNSDGFNIRRRRTQSGSFSSLFRVDSSGVATANGFSVLGTNASNSLGFQNWRIYNNAIGQLAINNLTTDLVLLSNANLALGVDMSGVNMSMSGRALFGGYSSTQTVGVNANPTPTNAVGFGVQQGSNNFNFTRTGTSYSYRGVGASTSMIFSSTDMSLLSDGGRITFNTANGEVGTFTSGGNFGVNTTSPNRFPATRGISVNGSVSSVLETLVTDANAGFLYSDGTQTIVGDRRNLPLIFRTNNANRGRITAGGNWLINTATDNGLDILQAAGSGSFTGGFTAQRGNFTSLVLNKDSVPLNTTNIMAMTLDSATGRVQRAQVSGSYTPTITGVTNVASSNTNVCFWSRAGRMVTVTGYLEVDPTAGNTATEFRLSLPIATSFTGGNSGKVAGAMVGLDGAASGSILADIAGNRASFRYTTPASAANMGLSFTFSYLLE